MSKLILASGGRRNLGEDIPLPFAGGYSATLISRGAFSSFDVIKYLAGGAPCGVLGIVSWALGDSTARGLVKWADACDFKEVRIVLDRSAHSLKPKAVGVLAHGFGAESLRLIRTHLKIYIVDDYVVESSANLNKNTRLEFYRVSRDAELVGGYMGLLDSMFREFPVPHFVEGVPIRSSGKELKRVVPRRRKL